MPWKKIFLSLGAALGLGGGLLLVLALLVSNYSGRMRDDEALNTYQLSLPTMPPGTLPLGGGIEVLRKADPRRLNNPLTPSRVVLDQGRKVYSNYCWPCHGPELDGKATVGQSFHPLPTALLGPAVQNQSDGELFYKISLGFKRQPPLYATVVEADRWAVIHYLRALARRPIGAGLPG